MGKTEEEFYTGACVFLDASKTLDVVGNAGVNQIKNKEAGLVLLGRMYIPSIVMQAFSAELFFKALIVHEGKQIKRTHRLDELLDMLDDVEKQAITDKMIEEMKKVKDAQDYDEDALHIDFEKAANTFDDWRYFFEGGSVSADFFFLGF